jgi:hypothetical protein
LKWKRKVTGMNPGLEEEDFSHPELA